MPILSNTESAERATIKTAFLPFARPDYVEGMLIGDDLDSLLSALYLHRQFGWQVKAVYCRYTNIWYTGSFDTFQQQLYSGRLFAVDLDIYHPSIPSLGHHVIALDRADELPGHTHSLNPNALRGWSIQQHFRRKYPLATIHFLRWLFDDREATPNAELLTWLADSSYINAQQYRENVEEWVTHFCPLPAFADMLPKLQTMDFEQSLQENILVPMSENPLCCNIRSSYRSRHLGLNGFQCQFNYPNLHNKYIQALLRLLGDLTAWPQMHFPEQFTSCVKGKRRSISVAEITETGDTLGEWLDKNGVFSYAFTFKDRMNYTSI
ncbi:MAG: hypothetical protein IT262_00805 [Saprospiraceae bacterium]|nr:hypothetical protein [Saprospiraceae bacterium]